VAVGYQLARLLRVGEGTDIVLQARTRDGAINANTFRVVGLVRSDNSTFDSLAAWLEFTDATPLALLGNARSHVAVRTPGEHAAAAAALAGHGFHVSTLEQECDDMLALNRIRRRFLSVVVGMIMLIAAVGIANTVIMAAFERVREIGTLLALGMRRRDIRLLFMLEGGVMGMTAGLLGAALGGGAVWHWSVAGIDLSDVVQSVGSNMAMSTMIYTQFTWSAVVGAVGFGVGVSVLASLWPANWASRIVPADAVKAD
jgi:putative ABC transport system permease protein